MMRRKAEKEKSGRSVYRQKGEEGDKKGAKDNEENGSKGRRQDQKRLERDSGKQKSGK